MQEANRPNIGITIDTAHFYAGDSTLVSITQIDPQKLVVLHTNDVERNVAKPDILDYHRVYPGEGILPLQVIISAVRATGWDGVLSVELFRKNIGSTIRKLLPMTLRSRHSRHGKAHFRPCNSGVVRNNHKGHRAENTQQDLKGMIL